VIRRFALVLGLVAALASPVRAESPAEEYDIEAMLANVTITVPGRANQSDSGRVTAIAVGALAGVVAVNFYMGGWAYLPFTGVAAATPMATAESIVAISRVYATMSAGAGAIIGNWLYDRSQPQTTSPRALVQPR